MLSINVNVVIPIRELVKLNSNVDKGVVPQRPIIIHIDLVKLLT